MDSKRRMKHRQHCVQHRAFYACGGATAGDLPVPDDEDCLFLWEENENERWAPCVLTTCAGRVKHPTRTSTRCRVMLQDLSFSLNCTYGQDANSRDPWTRMLVHPFVHPFRNLPAARCAHHRTDSQSMERIRDGIPPVWSRLRRARRAQRVRLEGSVACNFLETFTAPTLPLSTTVHQ